MSDEEDDIIDDVHDDVCAECGLPFDECTCEDCDESEDDEEWIDDDEEEYDEDDSEEYDDEDPDTDLEE